MFILKLLVGVLSIIVAVKIGKDKAEKDKNEYLYFNSLVVLCDKILSDLSYKKSKINELLSIKFNSSELNETLNSYLKGKNVELPVFLNEEEQFLVIDMLNTLGKSDTVAQIHSVNAFKNEFIKISNDKFTKYKKYNALFMKLGFISGLLIFILVI